MDPFYPTEAWSNIPAFQNIDEEGEFWDTHTLVQCGDDVCAELLDDGDDEDEERAAVRSRESFAESPHPTPRPEMTLGDIQFVVERRPDTYVAYPIGLGGVVVGQGDTFEETLESAKSATQFHIETFGVEV